MLRILSFACAAIVFGAPGAASAQKSARKNSPVPTPAPPAAAVTDSGLFTVLHGRDTVAWERFSRTATELHGALTLAGAARGVQQYTAVIGPDATIPLIEIIVREVADSGRAEGRIVQRARVIFKEDSVAID